MSETPPDLTTPEGKAAYRRELRGVAKRTRLAGFLAIAVGALLMMIANQGGGPNERTLAFLVLALGWALLVMAFVERTLYHRRRTRGA